MRDSRGPQDHLKRKKTRVCHYEIGMLNVSNTFLQGSATETSDVVYHYVDSHVTTSWIPCDTETTKVLHGKRGQCLWTPQDQTSHRPAITAESVTALDPKRYKPYRNKLTTVLPLGGGFELNGKQMT